MNTSLHKLLLIHTAVMLLFPVTLFAGGAALNITFSDAWQMVKEESDALKAARAKVEQAEFARKGSDDLNLPEITLSANYLYLDEAVELSPNDLFESMNGGDQAAMISSAVAQSYGLSPAQLQAGLTSTITERANLTSSLSAAWPLYTGGRIAAAQDIAEQQTVEANLDLQLETLQKFENLVRCYFGAILANRVFMTRKEVEAGLETHRNHAILLEDQGQIARVERLQAEAAYDKAVVERKKACKDLEIARVALSRMLKSEQLVIPSDKLFISDTLPSLETMIESTLARYPGLDILAAKKQQATGMAAIERGKYLPTVAMFGNLNIYEEDDLLSKLTPDWFVGVGLSIPLVERTGRSGKLHAAESAARRLDHLRMQAESDLSVLVEKTLSQAEQALEEFEGLLSSRRLAEETVKLRIKAFNQGLSTSLDVVDAELFLAGVKTQRAAAAYNYIVALGSLYMVGGRPEDFISMQNNNEIEGR